MPLRGRHNGRHAVRRRDRPGHNLVPVHRLRRRRWDRRRRAARAPPALSRGRAGSSTTPPRSGPTCEAVVDEATTGSTSPRSASPTSARPRVVWDRATGEPVHNAIVWQDTRTEPILRTLADRDDEIRRITGLPLATYFAGPKLRWLLDNVDGLRERAGRGEVLFGTIDSWLIWNLTGRHVTDVTNASRTLLMDLRTLDWEPGAAGRAATSRRRCCRRSVRRPRCTAPRAAAGWTGCRSPARSATSRRPCSGRPASRPARASAPTAPAASCWSTPVPRRWRRGTGCSPRSATRSVEPHRRTRWRARSPSPARWSSGCATTWA